MARPRIPNEVLELTGALDKNPQRRRPPAPKSDKPIGKPPSYFLADERAAWRELMMMSAAGVLTSADRWCVEIACTLIAKMRRREEMRGSDYSTLTTAISKLGLTPVDRTRLSAPPETAEIISPFAEFAIVK